MELTPYDKLRLKKEREGAQVRSRQGDPDPVRAVKGAAQKVATYRATKVILEKHKDEYQNVRAAESAYLRTLIESLYADGYRDEDELRDALYERLKNP